MASTLLHEVLVPGVAANLPHADLRDRVSVTDGDRWAPRTECGRIAPGSSACTASHTALLETRNRLATVRSEAPSRYACTNACRSAGVRRRLMAGGVAGSGTGNRNTTSRRRIRRWILRAAFCWSGSRAASRHSLTSGVSVSELFERVTGAP